MEPKKPRRNSTQPIWIPILRHHKEYPLGLTGLNIVELHRSLDLLIILLNVLIQLRVDLNEQILLRVVLHHRQNLAFVQLHDLFDVDLGDILGIALNLGFHSCFRTVEINDGFEVQLVLHELLEGLHVLHVAWEPVNKK